MPEINELTEKELQDLEAEIRVDRNNVAKREETIRAERKRRKEVKRSTLASFIVEHKESVLQLLDLVGADQRTIRWVKEEDYWDFDNTLEIQVREDRL
jgi:hypothetical protein